MRFESDAYRLRSAGAQDRHRGGTAAILLVRNSSISLFHTGKGKAIGLSVKALSRRTMFSEIFNKKAKKILTPLSAIRHSGDSFNSVVFFA
jgi:hypothetical protein